MYNAGVYAKSGSGSGAWFLEKLAKFLFLPSFIYIFFYFLLSYKTSGALFYLNIFFISLANVCMLFICMASGILLSYLRFSAILDDYLPSYKTKMLLKIIFIGFNLFLFTFIFFNVLYFNFIISITNL